MASRSTSAPTSGRSGACVTRCLTGRRAFEGATITDTLARILDHEPDWNALPTDTPVPIRKLLERCLRKDPKRRLHDIADALIELEDSSLAPGSSADTGTGSARLVAQQRRRERLAWIVAAASLAIASGAVALRRQEAPPLVSPIEFDIAPPENWYQGAGWDPGVAQLRDFARRSTHHGRRADAGRAGPVDPGNCQARHGARFRAPMVRVALSGRPTASRLDSSRAASSSPFAIAVVHR